MLSEDNLIGINQIVCQESGQQSCLLNPEMLSSALGVTQWFDTPELQASALFRSLILNHPFQDGNKRTATIALIYVCCPRIPDKEVGKVALRIAKGELKDPEEIAAILYDI